MTTSRVRPVGPRLLLVVDLQTVVTPGGARAIPGIESAIASVVRLVAQHDGPVIASRHEPTPDPPRTSGARGQQGEAGDRRPEPAALLPELRHLQSVDKHTYSAYRSDAVRTAVEGVERVVVCGVETDCCVLATVFDLVDDGIPTTVVPEAVAGPDRAAHDAALRALGRLGDLVEVRHIDDLVD
jgi:nicotinamidase-related amidase